MCKKYYGYTVNFSTIDFVKHIAKNCGWKGTKTPKDRAFLSNLKKALIEWDDVIYKITINAISCHQESEDKEHETLFFIHCREPEEIQKIINSVEAKTLFITRDNVELELSNTSDEKVQEFHYDYIIENNSDLDDLEGQAVLFLKKIKLI